MMYLFDIKSKDKKKKNVNVVNKTLDNKHTEMVSYFKQLQDSLPEKKNEQSELERQYHTLISNNEKSKTINDIFVQKKELEYQIEEKKREIESIENKYEEKEYYIKVGDILFDYYNIFSPNDVSVDDTNPGDSCIEESEMEFHGENTSDNDNEANYDFSDDDSNSDNDSSATLPAKMTLRANETGASAAECSVSKKNPQMTMFDFFNMQIVNPSLISTPIQIATSACDDNLIQKDILSFFDVKSAAGGASSPGESKVSQKSVLHHKYMHEIQKYYNPELRKTNLSICPKCGIDRIMMVTEGILVCQECCFMDKVIVDSERPSFREPPPEISYFAYKRINHFNEWLNQFQAKESSEIPSEVFDQIILELRKEKNLNLRNLKKSRVREILSKLKLNRYYEHVSHIIYKINGIPPPSIPNELEEILRNMFRTIQGPFMKVCPEIAKKRKNFLSYSYVLHKFLELLGYDELKKQFPLLKSREKLHRQDKIWQGICKDLNWQFIRSI
jgi:hypothetical protein